MDVFAQIMTLPDEKLDQKSQKYRFRGSSLGEYFRFSNVDVLHENFPQNSEIM